MKRLVVLTALILAFAVPAHAKVILETGSTTTASDPVAPGSVFVDIPFQLDEPGDWYVKLLALPDNPVYDGTPNGTIDPLSGWWVDFFLTNASGSPLTEDRHGQSVDGHLGYRVDGTPTESIDLDADTTYNLAVRLNIPAEGARTEGRVVVALAHVPAGAEGAASNGANLHSSTGYTIQITHDGDHGLVSGSGGGDSTTPPGTEDDTDPSDQGSSQGSDTTATGTQNLWIYMAFGGITVTVIVGWTVSSIVQARRIGRVEEALEDLQREWK